jgi:hypothetical protein
VKRVMMRKRMMSSQTANSTYKNLLKKIYALNSRQTVKMGLSKIHRLHEAMGLPSQKYSVVHVAGKSNHSLTHTHNQSINHS